MCMMSGNAQLRVELAAIQIANYTDANIIAVTRTSKKRERLLEAGAAHVIAPNSMISLLK